MSSPPDIVVADAALRLDAPGARPRRRGRLALAVLAALVVETATFGAVWLERGVPPPAQLNEIPVEIVVEPPPPPPPPAPEPEMKTQDVEKPATDAPREGKSDHDDEHVAEKETPAAAPPPPPEPTPSPEATKPAAEAPAPDLPKAAEAEAPTPEKTETPEPPAKPKPSVADVLAKAFDSVPDVEFGGAAIKSPVTGGAAKSTYLSMLYGLIVPRLHVPAVAHAYGHRLTGAVAFAVDGRGRLTHRFVAEGSGSMELDEAAMEAVAAASKTFPPPPKGAPIGMKFTYSVD
jgi:protein TonB